MTSDRPTIPAPRVQTDVRETEFLAAALAQLAEHLKTITPDEISARKQAARRREIRDQVGLYAAELGLRWAGHVGSTPTDAAQDTAGAA